MKPKIGIEWSWRHLAIYLNGSRDWLEFGLGMQLCLCFRKVCVRDDGSRCNSLSLHLRLLWFNLAFYLHV